MTAAYAATPRKVLVTDIHDVQETLTLLTADGSGSTISDDVLATYQAWDASRLTQARLLAGLTKQEVAGLINVSPAAVGQWEAGVRPPRPEHIAQLSRHLGVPLTFFRYGRPHLRLDAADAHFRSLRETRNNERDRAVAFVEQLWELTYALERIVELPAVDVPGLAHGEPSGEEIPEKPEAAAQLVRERWGVAEGPFPHLVRALENHGIVVSHVPFAGDATARIDAFSTSHLPRPLVVTTPDRANDVYRHRFTVAHELGHLVLHHDVEPGGIQQEREANAFASELLLPAEPIESELPRRLHLGALDMVARRWGVPTKSLIRRARELGIVTDVAARRAYQRYQIHVREELIKSQPVTLFQGETPALLRRAFELAEKHRGLSENDLARELVWDVSRVRLLLGMETERPRLTLVP